ncbi:MAG: N-acetyl-alpha-D-glucosaminyl L-malate synthase BshA [Planctomycetota bacterium]|nr:N-acetyl-alpha-D-glucosaminyl L-malate synthase BshA [Planctomycetota bacterium]MCX8040666.1 N-acetyl-alpha-D-glucosaminyl L-malate synthase BshA [Planctomycetota bacterium]MDW8372809.1 N-acetyl-alpha-D-glucosaminyl L-malate synthase BshA [Planctomycetota bacterium]
MRLVIVCYPTYGGSGAVAADLAQRLADRGHEVHVISYEVPFRLEVFHPNLLFHAVTIGDYPLFRHPPYTLHLTNKIIEVCEEFGCDIVHSHYAIPHAVSALLARQVLAERGRRLRLVTTLHGTDITLVGREPGYHRLTSYAIAQQDAITAPSRWLAEATVRDFAIASERIAVIPNAVDLERFRPLPEAPARRWLAPRGEAVLVHVSNFRPVKRVEQVVEAFAVLRRRLPAVLALVGDGPELPKAEQLARELGVRDDVRILGQQRPEAILQASDLFLLPSIAESFGLAALEALACGVPVIGYAAGGLPEVVEDGVSGILCPVGEPVCLGTLAANLLNDRPRYQQMRAAARARAERFAPGPIVDRYERLLMQLGGTDEQRAR